MTLDEFKKTYSANIKRLRGESSFKQDDLAEKINLSEKYISDIETGRSLGSLATLVAIANAFGVEPYELLLPDGKMARYNTSRTRKLMLALRENVSATLDTLENFLGDGE